jgi:hypothetical protein
MKIRINKKAAGPPHLLLLRFSYNCNDNKPPLPHVGINKQQQQQQHSIAYVA